MPKEERSQRGEGKHDCNEHAPEHFGGMNLGGGDDEQASGNIVYPGYNLEWNKQLKRNRNAQRRSVFTISGKMASGTKVFHWGSRGSGPPS